MGHATYGHASGRMTVTRIVHPLGPPRTLGRARGSRVTLQKVPLPTSHRLASSGSAK